MRAGRSRRSTKAALAAVLTTLLAIPSFAQQPSLTRDVDNGALHPFRAVISASLDPGEERKVVDGPVVPAGKRLVIENASPWIFTELNTPSTGLWLSPGGSSAFTLLDPTSAERKSNGRGTFVSAYTRLVKLYFEPGEILQMHVFFAAPRGAKIVNLYLSGYYVALR